MHNIAKAYMDYIGFDIADNPNNSCSHKEISAAVPNYLSWYMLSLLGLDT